MNACLIAYTFYKADHKVIRYAEALAVEGNRIDVISLKLREDDRRHIVLNGVNVYRFQTRNFNEKSPLSYFVRIFSFFVKGSIILFFKYLRYRYEIIHTHNMPDFLVFMCSVPK